MTRSKPLKCRFEQGPEQGCQVTVAALDFLVPSLALYSLTTANPEKGQHLEKNDRRLGASLWHFAVQRVLQMEACRHPATLEGALAHLQQFGGLGRAQTLIPEQIDHFTLRCRQGIDLLVKRAPGRQSLRLMRRIGRVRRRQATAECGIAG